MITPGFGVGFRSHAREARFGIGQGNVSVHVTEEGLVVLHDLLVDREGVGQERLILRSVGEDDWFVLAEPFDCDLALAQISRNSIGNLTPRRKTRFRKFPWK